MNTNDSEQARNSLDEQRELMELLSQETRHDIIQFLLGHPEHMASLDELNHMIENKSKKAIGDQVDRLIQEGILAEYPCEENELSRGLPSQFYGFTEFGIEVLGSFGYLDEVPALRAVYRKTRKPERIERHQNAPRPSLLMSVRDVLDNGGDD